MTDQTPSTAAGRALITEAGKRLLAWWDPTGGRRDAALQSIVAIEREAWLQGYDEAVCVQAEYDDEAEARALDRDALADRIQEAILDLDSRQLMAEAQGYFSAEWRRWTPREIAEDIARHVAREAPAASPEASDD